MTNRERQYAAIGLEYSEGIDQIGECVLQIDQGDYLQFRQGNDWGRSEKGSATIYPNPMQAWIEAKRLGVNHLVKMIERAPNT